MMGDGEDREGEVKSEGMENSSLPEPLGEPPRKACLRVRRAGEAGLTKQRVVSCMPGDGVIKSLTLHSVIPHIPCKVVILPLI